MNRIFITILGLTISFVINSTPLQAQELSFDFNNFANCARDAAGPGDCIGVAAEICMRQTPGGESTIGMGGCLNAELQAWDDLLNATYQALRSVLAQGDAEMAESGYNAPSQAGALQQMQRAWIPFRDDKCTFVRSLWGNGTGAGPATLNCLMRETAGQTLYLRDVLTRFQQ